MRGPSQGLRFEPSVGSDFASHLKARVLSAWDAAAAHPAETKADRLKQVAGNVRGKGRLHIRNDYNRNLNVVYKSGQL